MMSLVAWTMKCLPFLLLTLTFLNRVKCDKDSDSDVQLSDSANCFSLTFYKLLAEEKSNMVLSPLSLDVLLSLLLVGSNGTTAEQLQKALVYNGLSLQDMQDSFRRKQELLKNSDKNTLNFANSIWIQDKFQVENSFKTAASQNFFSEERSVDFAKSPENARDQINKWASEKTNRMIPVLFENNLDSLTVMVLVNAMYFKGKWQNQFDKSKTQDGKFSNNGSPNDQKNVKFMNQTGKFMHKLDSKTSSEVLTMEYEGGNMSMTIILPSKDSNLQKLEKSLQCEGFKNLIKSDEKITVHVSIPRFNVTSDYSLKEPILKAGIIDAFESNANFSGISKKEGVFVSEVVQKAVIEVDEEGSKAAVATGVVVQEKSLVVERKPASFVADRPFLYLIYHKQTNLIMFMGRVTEL